MLRHGHTSLDLKPTPICFFLILPPLLISSFFFFNDTATTEIYTLSLHDALPISILAFHSAAGWLPYFSPADSQVDLSDRLVRLSRSEEHTSELQSQSNLVCRLLLEKKKKDPQVNHSDEVNVADCCNSALCSVTDTPVST